MRWQYPFVVEWIKIALIPVILNRNRYSASTPVFYQVARSELAGRTSQLANEIGFSKGLLLKNHLLRAHCLGFDWSDWIVFIKSEILITTGMVWPVSSEKWKALLVLFSRTSQLANEIGFFQRVVAEKPSPSCILFRIWLIWLVVFIKSEILITTGIVWQISSDKWKALLVLFSRPSRFPIFSLT